MFNLYRSRSRFALLIIPAMLLLAIHANAQSKPDVQKLEREIRLLDQAAAKAILEKDEAGIDLYFAPNSVTNNPRGGLTHGNGGVKALFKSGVINYASFERVIEHVEIHGSTAVVMGNESLTLAGTGGQPGDVIKRRYTNVWMKNGGKWKIVARHASVLCE
jgi:ketosteroid isomerase-like protein